MMQIVPLVKKDIADAVNLIDKCFPDSDRIRNIEAIELMFNFDEELHHYSSFFNVAKFNNKIVGVGGWNKYEWFDIYKMGYICTTEKYRHLGIGTKIVESLINHIIDYSKLVDYSLIQLDCFPEREKFYNKFGFETECDGVGGILRMKLNIIKYKKHIENEQKLENA